MGEIVVNTVDSPPEATGMNNVILATLLKLNDFNNGFGNWNLIRITGMMIQ